MLRRLTTAAILATLSGALSAEARPTDVSRLVPRGVAAPLLGCWELSARPQHRVVLVRAGGGVTVRQRYDTVYGRRRVLEAALLRRASDDALYFRGFSSNHHAGLLVLVPRNGGVVFDHFFRTGPAAPWRRGARTIARRCTVHS